MLNFDNFSIISVDRFTYKSATTGAIHFMTEEMQGFTLTNGEEVVYQTGRSGRKLSSMKKNKTSGISFDSGYVSLSQIGAQVGKAVESSDTATILSPQVEKLKVGVGGTSCTTTYTAEGTAGSEIQVIYTVNSDGTPGTKYLQGETASATVFSYAPLTKAITLPTGVFSADDLVLVTYEYKTKGKRVVNDSNTFSLNGEGILEMTLNSACDKETAYYGKLWIPTLAANGSFELAMGGDQTVHAFSGESLSSSCLGGSFWEIIIPEDE